VARIGNITFACAEPVPLAEFWAAATGYRPIELPPEVTEPIQREIDEGKLDPGAWAMLVPPDGAGPHLLFQRRPRSSPQDIPIHLDLNAEDREAEVERLVALGATVVETKSHTIGGFTETWTVMRDPEGNGFCVQ
jgi:predicted enzyme related to lactoylglutathione lyase